MAYAAGWLSLRVLEESKLNSAKSFLISIPKKKVPLAVRRNRIRRVLREALRMHPVFQGNSKTFSFYVLRDPRSLSLREASDLLDQLSKHANLQ